MVLQRMFWVRGGKGEARGMNVQAGSGVRMQVGFGETKCRLVFEFKAVNSKKNSDE